MSLIQSDEKEKKNWVNEYKTKVLFCHSSTKLICLLRTYIQIIQKFQSQNPCKINHPNREKKMSYQEIWMWIPIELSKSSGVGRDEDLKRFYDNNAILFSTIFNMPKNHPNQNLSKKCKIRFDSSHCCRCMNEKKNPKCPPV